MHSTRLGLGRGSELESTRVDPLSGPEAIEGKKRKKNVAELDFFFANFFFSVTAGHHIF